MVKHGKGKQRIETTNLNASVYVDKLICLPFLLSGGSGPCCSCMGCTEDGDFSHPEGAT